ncbi:hypothetical protein [Pararhizobium sp. LjRoot238]|uniref:hypothetical protein n=1 Tax=Pararhizobium sp. LjRoot238 TaxID=3342293 RepID=UPI003ECFE778
MDDLYKLRGILAELSHAVPPGDRYEMLRYLIGMAELEVSDLVAPLRPDRRKRLNPEHRRDAEL